MMDKWATAIQFVLAYEGGYVNDPQDPGGETKFGISKKAYPSLNIKDLTLVEAQDIYRRDYWNACECDELPAKWAIAVMDTAVNMGVRKAIRLMQIALDVGADGVVGSQTVAAAHKSSENALGKFMALRAKEYIDIMDRLPALKGYAFNWMYRLFKLSNIVFEGEGISPEIS